MMENCPLLQSKPNRFISKKAMSATWDGLAGSEFKEDSDNEEAIPWLLRDDDEENEIEVIDNPSHDDLLCANARRYAKNFKNKQCFEE